MLNENRVKTLLKIKHDFAFLVPFQCEEHFNYPTNIFPLLMVPCMLKVLHMKDFVCPHGMRLCVTCNVIRLLILKYLLEELLTLKTFSHTHHHDFIQYPLAHMKDLACYDTYNLFCNTSYK